MFNQAIAAFCSILSKITATDFEDELMEMLNGLVGSEVIFYRISGINLLPHLYKTLSSNSKLIMISYMSNLG